MKEVALAAGVGKSTVSLALRNDPRLKPETCARVQKIAEEMGYRSNPTVAHLMAQLRTSRKQQFQGTIALLNAAEDESLLSRDPTYSEWVQGCIKRADQLGYSIDTFWLHDKQVAPEKLHKILYARNIRGIILAAVTNKESVPQEFFWQNFSCVCIGMHLPRPDLYFATNDQFSTVRLAFQELMDLGYQRPGLVLDPERDSVIEYRFSAGFWAAQKQLKVKDRVPQLELSQLDRQPFETWLKKHQPDAIVTIHPEVKDWLAELKIKIPQDIGLVHLDRTDSEEHKDWAGMDQKNDAVGAAAVDMLLSQIYRSESGVPEFSRSLQIESAWCPGKTVRKQR